MLVHSAHVTGCHAAKSIPRTRTPLTPVSRVQVPTFTPIRHDVTPGPRRYIASDLRHRGLIHISFTSLPTTLIYHYNIIMQSNNFGDSTQGSNAQFGQTGQPQMQSGGIEKPDWLDKGITAAGKKLGINVVRPCLYPYIPLRPKLTCCLQSQNNADKVGDFANKQFSQKEGACSHISLRSALCALLIVLLSTRRTRPSGCALRCCTIAGHFHVQ